MPTFHLEAAILDNGRILLTRRREAPLWTLPRGVMAAGESPTEALARVVREQTGLDIRVGRLVGLYARPRWRHGGDTTLLFLGLIVGGALRPTPQTGGAQYFFPRSLPESLLPWYPERVADALAGQQRPFVRSDNVAWPFGVEDASVVFEWLLTQTGGDRERAIREGLRRLGVSLREEDIAQLAREG